MNRARPDDPSRRAIIAALDAASPPVTLKQASRAIGRNDAYLQQFLYRGTPRRLPEDARYRCQPEPASPICGAIS